MNMWWLGLLGIAAGLAQLVVQVVHLRRLERLARAQGEMTAEWADLVNDLRATLHQGPSRRGCIAACNDASSTVEGWLNYPLTRSSGWRICATSGMAAGCALISTSLWAAAACFSWGLMSAAAAEALGRKADSLARQIRGGWNGLIRSLARSFPEESVKAEVP